MFTSVRWTSKVPPSALTFDTWRKGSDFPRKSCNNYHVINTNSVHIIVVNIKGHWQKNNLTHYVLVGEIGQGKTSKARTEPTDTITHQMREGQAHGIMPKGMPNAYTPRWAWFTHLCGWDYILGHVNRVQQNSHVPSLMGLQYKVEGIQQATIPTQVRTYYNVIISLSNYPFIVIYFYKHFTNFTEQAFFILCKFSTVPPAPLPPKF